MQNSRPCILVGHGVICKNSNERFVKVTGRGLPTLSEFSKKRKNEELEQYLITCQEEITDVYVHEECRKRFNNNKRLSIDETNISEKRKKHKQDSLWKPSTGKLIVFCVMVFA